MNSSRSPLLLPATVLLGVSLVVFFYFLFSPKQYHLTFSLLSNKSGNLEIYYQYDLNDPELKFATVEIQSSEDFRKYRLALPGAELYALRFDPHIAGWNLNFSSVSLQSNKESKEIYPLYGVEPNHEVEISESDYGGAIWHVADGIVDPMVWFLLAEPVIVSGRSWEVLLVIAMAIGLASALIISLLRYVYIKSQLLQTVLLEFHQLIKGSSFIHLLAVISISYTAFPYVFIGANPMFTAASFVGIIGWAFLSRFKIQPAKCSSQNLIIIVFGILSLSVLVSILPLTAPIAYKGDEDYHISSIEFLIRLFDDRPWILVGVLTMIVGVVIVYRFIGKISAVLLLLVSSILLGSSISGIGSLETYLIRYPSLSKWFMVTPVYLFESVLGLRADEWVYRLTPLIAYTAILVYLFLKLEFVSLGSRIALLLAIASIPNLWYYSSILYPELLLILLLCVVIFHLDAVHYEKLDQIKESPFWFAAICAGFLKETYLPVIAALILLRAVFLFIGHRAFRLTSVREFVLFAFGTAFPLGYYVVIRKFIADDPRGYKPFWENVFNGDLYLHFALNLWQQYGILLVIALAGVGFMISRKLYKSVFAHLVVFAAVVLFYLLDYAANFGYSRFNLLLLPTLLYFAYQSILGGVQWKNYIPVMVAVVWLMGNLFLTPFNLDGSRKPLWSSNSMDILERSFPYRSAIDYFLNNEITGGFALVNEDKYRYKVDFYLKEDEYENYVGYYSLSSFKEKYSMDDERLPNLILSQIQFKNLPDDTPLKRYRELTTFENAAHVLYLYER